MASRRSLEEVLAERTREGELYEMLPDKVVRCQACGHRCKIAEGKSGNCKVRFNRDGKLRVPTGYTAGLQVDPIEKKPLFHVLPGCQAMSFGMLGCNFHCAFCQNWVSSQTLRDPEAGARIREIPAQEIVDLASKYGARAFTATYNEPLITSEWAVEIFKLAKPSGFKCGYVSNGHATPEVIEYLRPWLDAYKVDLKSFQDKRYRELGGVLQHVLDTIRRLREMAFWVEVVTLVVPTLNDSDGELRDMARFLVGVSPDIPWHVTAFHSDYRMSDVPSTPTRTILRAAEIGKEEGLNYVYAGNRPDMVGNWENTTCPGCDALLVERRGFHVFQTRVEGGKCPDCGREIAGIWE